MSKGNPHRRPQRGRPRNATRDAATLAGFLYFQGNPCRYGHEGKRYTSTGACVACYAERQGRAVDLAGDEFAGMWA
jgi:hypothetical protein